jgi:hypothetical protein
MEIEEKQNVKVRPEIVFVAMVYLAGAFFVNLPGHGFCELTSQEQEVNVRQALTLILAISAALLAIYNFFFFAKCSVTVLKGYNWFVNAVITATVIVYHFPVALLNIVFVFPLLHNSVSLFGWKASEKIELGQKLLSLAYLIAFVVFSIITLLGTVILKDDFKLSNLTEMLHVAIKDTSCTGSNLYIYFCTIFVPNVLTII